MMENTAEMSRRTKVTPPEGLDPDKLVRMWAWEQISQWLSASALLEQIVNEPDKMQRILDRMCDYVNHGIILPRSREAAEAAYLERY